MKNTNAEAQKNYLQINKDSWNNKLSYHLNSEFYDMKGFLNGKSSLNTIELDLLGNLKGKSILHLQCHFGQDSISLAKLGAEVTAIDISDESIKKAKELSTQTNTKVTFICCDVYSLKNHLNKKFDIVFASYGTICWLPNMTNWAAIVWSFLKPTGQLIFIEFHPVVWMYDDDFKKITYDYFNTEAIVEIYEGSYAAPTANIKQQYVTWNHGLSEVITALLEKGLSLEKFYEYDYSPYRFAKYAFEDEPKKFRILGLKKRIPITYAIVAKKS